MRRKRLPIFPGLGLALFVLVAAAGCSTGPTAGSHDLHVSNILDQPVEVLVHIEVYGSSTAVYDGTISVAAGTYVRATTQEGETTKVRKWSTTETPLQLPDGDYIVRATWNGTEDVRQITLGPREFEILVSTSVGGVAVSVASLSGPSRL